MENNCCGNCIYSEKKDFNTMICRRFPPTIPESTGFTYARYPHVNQKSISCGEFKPRPKKRKKLVLFENFGNETEIDIKKMEYNRLVGRYYAISSPTDKLYNSILDIRKSILDFEEKYVNIEDEKAFPPLIKVIVAFTVIVAVLLIISISMTSPRKTETVKSVSATELLDENVRLNTALSECEQKLEK